MSAPVITDKGTEVESRLAAYKRINARLLAAVNAVVAAERGARPPRAPCPPRGQPPPC